MVRLKSGIVVLGREKILKDLGLTSEGTHLVYEADSHGNLNIFVRTCDNIGVDWLSVSSPLHAVRKVDFEHAKEKKRRGEVDISKRVSNLLDHSLGSGFPVTIIDESIRGEGKTASIIKKASELGAVVITDTKPGVEYTISLSEYMGCNVFVMTPKQLLQTGINSKKLLVDELVSVEDIQKLERRGHEVLGGFTRIVV